MTPANADRLSISLLTREYPPHIYGGAGVHVGQLVPQLRKLIDVDVQCMGEPREGATAHAENFPEGANAALRVFGADLSMTAAVPPVDLVHSHTWYANLAGHLTGSVPRHSPRNQCALARAAPTVEGRAVRRRLPAVLLGRTDRLRGGRRGDLGQRRDARRHPGLVRQPGSGESARDQDGIDPDEFAPDSGTDVVTSIGMDLDRPTVVFVGRITRQKGLIHLVRAAEQFDAETQLVLLAGAPDTPEIAASVSRGQLRCVGGAGEQHELGGVEASPPEQVPDPLLPGDPADERHDGRSGSTPSPRATRRPGRAGRPSVSMPL